MVAELLAAVGVLGGMGAVLGLVLAGASLLFNSGGEEKLQRLTEALPGANCGACGYPGCAAYAAALLAGTARPGACPVGKAPVAKKLEEILGE